MKPTTRLALKATLFAKILALVAFLLLYRAFPIETRFTLYENKNFVGSRSAMLAPWIVYFSNFDGYHYLTIAKDGYTKSQAPFFPLYPALVRTLQRATTLPYILPAQIISLAALFGGLVIALKLLALDGQKHRSLLFLGVLLVFPTAYSYTATYNDSLFFALATWCLYLGRKHRWIEAGIVGGIATLTRLNGLALLPYLVIEYLSTPNTKKLWTLHPYIQHLTLLMRHPKKFLPLLWALCVPLAFIAFLGYLHMTFGDWRVVTRSMHVWGQDKLVFPLQTLWRYIKILVNIPIHTVVFWVAAAELGAISFYIGMLWKTWRKLRPSYWVFIATSILIPSLTGTFQGMPRYGLHLYPLFLVITVTLAGTTFQKRLLYFAISLALYVCCITLFTHGFFIA
jgi:hypothetical protein